MVEQLYKQYIDKLMAAVQPMNEYKNTFISHCKEFGPRISTGILVFDKALNGGLANELYIMGAETSTGKSAFVERFLELSLFYGLSSPLNSEMICIFPYF